jgi:hypothetical protein
VLWLDSRVPEVLVRLTFELREAMDRETMVEVDRAVLDTGRDVADAAIDGTLGVRDVPAAPVWLVPESIEAATAVLAWQAPVEHDVLALRLRVETVHGVEVREATLGANVTRFVVGGLAPSKPYRARLHARNANGEGAESTLCFRTAASVASARHDLLFFFADEWNPWQVRNAGKGLDPLLPLASDLNDNERSDELDLRQAIDLLGER